MWLAGYNKRKYNTHQATDFLLGLGANASVFVKVISQTFLLVVILHHKGG